MRQETGNPKLTTVNAPKIKIKINAATEKPKDVLLSEHIFVRARPRLRSADRARCRAHRAEPALLLS